MATSQTGSTADVEACSDNELVDVENHKNEARFTFSQIHQYLQYSTYPSDFQKSYKQVRGVQMHPPLAVSNVFLRK